MTLRDMACHVMSGHDMSPPGSCPSSWPPAPPSSCSPGRWCWPPGSSRSAASCNNNNINYKTLTIKYFLYDILASGYNDNVCVTYTYTFLSLQFCNFLLTFIVFQQQQSISVKYQKMIFPNFLVYENIDSLITTCTGYGILILGTLSRVASAVGMGGQTV